jgi:hypothetical protein
MIGAPPHLWGTHLAHYVSAPRGKIRQIEQFAHCRPLSVSPSPCNFVLFFCNFVSQVYKEKKSIENQEKSKEKE